MMRLAAACGVLLLSCERFSPCRAEKTMAAVPPTEMRSYENPILPGFHPDPSICRVGADYYLATSSFEYFPGVPLFHSRDLLHWEKIGYALTRPSQLQLENAKSSEGIYAPTLRYHDGTFYLVTTNMSGGGSFYVTTRDPRGEWSDPIWIKASAWSMDPSFFFDDDGRVYYTLHGGGERGGIYQAELDLARGQLMSEPRLIWSGTGGIWPEAPHLYKRGGKYYLMIAEGGTGYGHAVTVARSASAFGPFEAFEGNPVLTHRHREGHPIQATGHADLVRTESGSEWLVLLGIRPTDTRHHHLGRETFLAPLAWDDAGWPVVNAGQGIELSMSAAGLPEPAPFPAEPVRDGFDRAPLGLVWNHIRNPRASAWSFLDRPGFLRLNGTRASLDTVSSPAFVGRRQQHFDCRVEALLEFSPGRDGEEAGLTLRQNEDNHYDLSLVRTQAERRVVLRTRVKGQSRTLASVELREGPVVFTILARKDEYEFFYAPPGAERRALGRAPTVPLSTEAASGFTGVYIGMYATTSSAEAMAPADFDWFDYAPGRN